MQKIFFDSRILDEAAREHFGLTEDIMMENAALALEKELEAENSVLIAVGGGNNGGDGWALARRICAEKAEGVVVLEAAKAKSTSCLLQRERAIKCGVQVVEQEEAQSYIREQGKKFCAVVDCVFGSGFHGELPCDIRGIMGELNALCCKKIACDIPTGLDSLGNAAEGFFRADVTVTMGALKIALFSSEAKDACGKIRVAPLGIPQKLFEAEGEHCAMLLEETDLTLPNRKNQNVHKGTFGHASLVAGEKTGAAVLAASAALRFGTGLVTVVGRNLNERNIPFEIMTCRDFPENTTAVAVGMGLGRREEDCAPYLDFLLQHKDIPCVLDADIFYSKRIKGFLEQRAGGSGSAPIILTPHPKEFSVLLERCGLGTHSASDVAKNAYGLAKKFLQSFPGATLVLKGATVLIATLEAGKEEIYVNPHGTCALAKGGSGDVLTGLALSLLAQGWSAKQSAINASLSHALASKRSPCDYALTPLELIKYTSLL